MNKYNAKKTVIDGITFDSMKEGKRYIQLKHLKESKKISELEVHPSFILQESFKLEGQGPKGQGPKGKTYQAINYIADFMYYDPELDESVVEDVKGMKTDVYNLKKKMFLKKYGGELIFKEV